MELARSALNITHEEPSVNSPESENVVFINHVATPEFPRATAFQHNHSGPTPPGKRVLDQGDP